MIDFLNYEKNFYNSTAFSIRIPRLQLENKIYWLKGQNGSGKTTLLKSIAGLIRYQGLITVAKSNFRKDRISFRKMVSYAEAKPVYPNFLKGRELIEFYCKTLAFPPENLKALLDLFGVATFSDHVIGSYSSGMTKKLSLLLAFIGYPKLILLDEPLVTLDTEAVSNMIRLIWQYHLQGTSFIITSHQEIQQQPYLKMTSLLLKNGTISIE